MSCVSKLRAVTVPCPALQWDGEPEAPAEFLARLQGSIDYSTTDLKGSKHTRRQQASASGQQAGTTGGDEQHDGGPTAAAAEAARAAAAQHTSDPAALAGAVRYTSDPAESAAYARGWEQAKELDRMWDTRDFKAVSGERGWGGGTAGVGRPCRQPAVPAQGQSSCFARTAAAIAPLDRAAA